MGDCMRCIHCEYELEQGTIYCSNCGKRQIEHNAILCIKANYSKIKVFTINSRKRYIYDPIQSISI